MIKVAKKIAKKTVLITNGSLLSKSKIEQLIEAEIDTVTISLQGLNASDYKKNCGFDIDYEKFLDNLSFFFKNKKNTTIWVKIPDLMLDNKDKFDIYESSFSDKADKLTIMSLQPYYTAVDYSKIGINMQKTMYNDKKIEFNICPMPFYMLYLLYNGDIYPCCSIEQINSNLCFGNINKLNSLSGIWNSHILNNFRLKQCVQTYKSINVCKNCAKVTGQYNDYDNIDSNKESLIKNYIK
jgi:radical SAM protein with 4Fe4S-binding SPASM domain